MPLHIVIACVAVLEYEGTDKKIFPRSAIFPIVLFCRRVLGGKTTMDENAKTKKKSIKEIVKDFRRLLRATSQAAMIMVYIHLSILTSSINCSR